MTEAVERTDSSKALQNIENISNQVKVTELGSPEWLQPTPDFFRTCSP